ncbi:hypothetical protein FPZ43_13830 [Mucilaginibacter pallidiroseus]|uniref:Calcineurin-like phosphoesterase domain-containing protein n=1 Tax=Mucilaginibacter pallidiroseus TaxID=2599295 RepID=A0A563U863_9SPHI|nr:metallophosphoesterase [Mucilaginibacter pallidiroseus]TWR27547.1 hypothetical protein FPZ43_13830 [Mucilaginibacter pallidiroseus]
MRLEVGYNHPFEVREYKFNTRGLTNIDILFISDLHLNGYCGRLIESLINKVRRLNPHIVLLGGDYVDTKSGLELLSQLLNGIAVGRHVLAIAGNHDYFFGLKRIWQVMTDYGVNWIEKHHAVININGFNIRVNGNISEIAIPKCDINILLLHKPIDEKLFAGAYDIVFAGHLHGCQAVFWETEKGLYPGRYIYKWNVKHVITDNFIYLISKGIGDTLPIRYNCKKDIILVNTI